MEFKQMKFRISSPEQFTQLALTLHALGWTITGETIEEWIAYRHKRAKFLYCDVGSNGSNSMAFCTNQSYFDNDTPNYEEVDAASFILHHFLAGTYVGVPSAPAPVNHAPTPHPHRDIMIALANDSSTIVEVLRRDGKWAVTDNPVFNPHQQFRIGKTNLDRIIEELIAEIGSDSSKLERVNFALSAGE